MIMLDFLNSYSPFFVFFGSVVKMTIW